jgi:copper chaperone
MTMPSYRVPDMSCGHCKDAIEKAVTAVDGRARVTVDLEAKTVVIESEAAQSDLRAAIEEAGYDAFPLG